jgi:hypothetical protein
MPASDAAVLEAIEADILRPEVITATLRKAVDRLKPANLAARARLADLQRRHGTIIQELDRLTAALAAGGNLTTLVQAIREREEQRDTLAAGDRHAEGRRTGCTDRLAEGRAPTAREARGLEATAPASRAAGTAGAQEAFGGTDRVHAASGGRLTLLRVHGAD